MTRSTDNDESCFFSTRRQCVNIAVKCRVGRWKCGHSASSLIDSTLINQASSQLFAVVLVAPCKAVGNRRPRDPAPIDAWLVWLVVRNSSLEALQVATPEGLCVFLRNQIRSQKLVKKRTRNHFLFSAIARVCVVFLNVTAQVQTLLKPVASMVAGVWTGVGLSNLKKFQTRI